MADFLETELEQRLNLYQRFVKLYEHHGNLLDEILEIENTHQVGHPGIQNYFIEGLIEDSGTALVTNLGSGKTQKIIQPQQVWLLGRDQISGIFLCNPYISRHHAAIRYIQSQGCFYFTDLKSTNGSFINGEPVYSSVQLKDGDRIRIGTLTFSFFVNASTQTLPDVGADILMQLTCDLDIPANYGNQNSYVKTRLIDDGQESTLQFLREFELIDEDDEEIYPLPSTQDETSQDFDRLLQGNLYPNPIYKQNYQDKNAS